MKNKSTIHDFDKEIRDFEVPVLLTLTVSLVFAWMRLFLWGKGIELNWSWVFLPQLGLIAFWMIALGAGSGIYWVICQIMTRIFGQPQVKKKIKK